MTRVSRTLSPAMLAGAALLSATTLLHAAAPAPTVAPAAAAAADTVTLWPRFKAGQTMDFTLDFSRDDTLTLPNMGAADPTKPAGETASGPQSQTRSTTQTLGYRAEVLEASEGSTIVQLTLTSIKITVRVSAKEFVYDSAAPEGPDAAKDPLLLAAKPIIGAPFKLHFDAAGAITKVENPGVAITNPQFLNYLEHLTDEQLIRLRWGPVFFVKRDGAAGGLKPGSTWSSADAAEFSAIGNVSIINSYTLESAKDGRASIAVTGRWDVGAPEGSAPMMKLTASEFTGSGVWDTADGVAREFRWKQAIEITGNAQGMSVIRKTDSEYTITRAAQ